jgi:hypothetical protein
MLLIIKTVYSDVLIKRCVDIGLVDLGGDEVTLQVGKQATKRMLQFAYQALLAVFGNQHVFRQNF